jgi:hypothetical protein
MDMFEVTDIKDEHWTKSVFVKANDSSDAISMANKALLWKMLDTGISIHFKARKST